MLQENLVILRNYKGISQEEIAGIIGISRQAYAKWERGETVPDIDKCAKLASFYGITLDDLIHFKTHQEGMVLPPGPKGKHIYGAATINDKGQVLIPKVAREQMNINKGDKLIILGEEGSGLALIKAEVLEQQMNYMSTMSKNEAKE